MRFGAPTSALVLRRTLGNPDALWKPFHQVKRVASLSQGIRRDIPPPPIILTSPSTGRVHLMLASSVGSVLFRLGIVVWRRVCGQIPYFSHQPDFQ